MIYCFDTRLVIPEINFTQAFFLWSQPSLFMKLPLLPNMLQERVIIFFFIKIDFNLDLIIEQQKLHRCRAPYTIILMERGNNRHNRNVAVVIVLRSCSTIHFHITIHAV